MSKMKSNEFIHKSKEQVPKMNGSVYMKVASTVNYWSFWDIPTISI